MKLYAALMLVIANALCISVLHAALGSNELAEARQQGSNSLIAFQKLITASNYKLMGFDSTNEVPTATIGAPIHIYTLPLKHLRNYQLDGSFAPLLEPRDEAIIPISVQGKVRSSTTVRSTGRGWVTSNWGQPKLIRELTTTMNSISQNLREPGTELFVVHVPVFDIWFVGYRDVQGETVLRATSTISLGPVVVSKNQPITSAAMFRLAAASQQYNGLPN